MAEIYTSYFGGNTSPRVRLVYNITSQTGGAATITWILDYVPTSGYAASTNGQGRSWTIAIDGQTRSGSFNINGVSGATRISTGTITVNKQGSSRNISLSASFGFNLTWSGTYAGTLTTTGTLKIDAKSSHTVTYNANGGSGAPGSQTKWYGSILTLSSTRPTRSGYTFIGWATSSSGSVAYQPGGKYGDDKNITLYAIWSADSYTVTYNANGGSGAPSTQTKTHGINLTLSSTKPTRTNYNFLGWGTSSGSTTVSYSPGSTYSNNASITLYAIWSVAYTPPRVLGLRAERCTSDGTLKDEGTYIKITGTWYTDVSANVLYIRYKSYGASSWTTTSYTLSGTTGTISYVVGSGAINTEYQYDVQVEIVDSSGNTILNTNVAAMHYIIDFLKGGKGMAIGKPANAENSLQIAYYVSMDKALQVTGTLTARSKIKMLEGWTSLDVGLYDDLNDYTTTGFYKCKLSSTARTVSNTAEAESFSLEVYDNNGVTQIFTTYHTKPKRYIRSMYNSSWGAWSRMIDENYMNDFHNKILYTGSIYTGSTVSIPELSKYSLLACQPRYDGVMMLGYKTLPDSSGRGSIHFSARLGNGGEYSATFVYDNNLETLRHDNNSGDFYVRNIIGVM